LPHLRANLVLNAFLGEKALEGSGAFIVQFVQFGTEASMD
jgi:hypothetical protein